MGSALHAEHKGEKDVKVCQSCVYAAATTLS